MSEQNEEALRECQRRGHPWDVISAPHGPVRLVCPWCGKSYRVVPEHERAAPAPTPNVNAPCGRKDAHEAHTWEHGTCGGAKAAVTVTDEQGQA